MADDDDDLAEAGEDLADANEELAEVIEDFESDIADLKELIDEHPDAALKTSLGAEVAKIEEALGSMKSQLGGGPAGSGQLGGGGKR
jgi:hypothetical protein